MKNEQTCLAWAKKNAGIFSMMLGLIILLQSCCINCPPWNYDAAKKYAKQKQLAAASKKPAATNEVANVELLRSPAPVAGPALGSATENHAVVNPAVYKPASSYKAVEIKERDKLPLGIKAIGTHLVAGPNMSFKSSKEGNDVYGESNHKHKPGLGLQVGVVSNFVFSKKLAVSTGLLFKQNNASESLSYSTGGGTEPGGGYSYEYEDKYSYSYLSAPMLAVYKFNDQLSAVAGPELNYLLGASVKSSSGDNESEKTSLTKNSVRVGLGVQAGIKYTIPSGGGNSPWAIQLVYDHRISRLNKKESSYDGGGGYYNYETPAWNMKSIQLSVTRSLCSAKKSTN